MRNLLLLLIFLPGLCVGGHRLENLIQMLDYVGVDYPAAVANGEIIDDAEYQEMQGIAGQGSAARAGR
jgi:high-affinity iron transporter